MRLAPENLPEGGPTPTRRPAQTRTWLGQSVQREVLGSMASSLAATLGETSAAVLCTTLRDAGKVLGLSDRVVATAASFLQRQLRASESVHAERSDVVFAASLFLAAKTCEEPRRIRGALHSPATRCPPPPLTASPPPTCKTQTC